VGRESCARSQARTAVSGNDDFVTKDRRPFSIHYLFVSSKQRPSMYVCILCGASPCRGAGDMR
jgi:hypothetical protein